MTGSTWFIADPHFGHQKVSELRGFSETNLHDNKIVNQWCKQVREADVVYVLGDLSAGGRAAESYALEVLATLPGHKRLIAGNHDSVSGIHRKMSSNWPKFKEVFETVNDFGRVRINGDEVLLSHYPYEGDHFDDPRFMQFRLRNEGLPLIHGHTHSDVRFAGREACVSWEAWKRMVNVGDLTDWVKESAHAWQS